MSDAEITWLRAEVYHGYHTSKSFMVFMVNLIQLIYSTVNYSPVRDDGDEEEEDGYDNDDTLEVLKHDETIL